MVDRNQPPLPPGEEARLYPTSDAALQRAKENGAGAELPYTHPVMEQARAEQAATERRLAREEHDVNNGKIAGHDFPRERHEQEERSRERGY